MSFFKGKWVLKHYVVLAFIGAALMCFRGGIRERGPLELLAGLVGVMLPYLGYLVLLADGFHRLRSSGRMQLSFLALLAMVLCASFLLLLNIEPYGGGGFYSSGIWAIGFPYQFYVGEMALRPAELRPVFLLLNLAVAILCLVWSAVLGNWLSVRLNSKLAARQAKQDVPENTAADPREIGR